MPTSIAHILPLPHRIADQAPASGLAPANGTSERYVLQARLNYIASEVHASFGKSCDVNSNQANCG